jgi:putative ABC transport system substrate-binding protein
MNASAIPRRQFLALAGAAALAGPAATHAQQQSRRLPVVGFALQNAPAAGMVGPDPTYAVARDFIHGLRDLGWIDGRTIHIERLTAEGQPDRAPGLVANILAKSPDVIFVGAGVWLLDATRQATRTIPTVVIFSFDPVAAGLLPSLARPGGNLTGVTGTTGRELDEKRLQLLREMAPGLARPAFLGTQQAWDTYRGPAAAAVLPPIFARVERPEDFDAAFASLRRERADAVMVGHGPVLHVNAQRIANFATAHRLPSIYPWREGADAGGLITYGTNAVGLFRQAASYVDRILRGARPAEMAIEQPTRFELVINKRTADALGLTIPPTLLISADEVIE